VQRFQLLLSTHRFFALVNSRVRHKKHFFRRTQCDTGALQNGDRAPDKSGRSGAKLRADAPSLSPIYCGDFYSNLEDLTREERVEKNPAAYLWSWCAE
jgi:hypothetical protein